MKAPAVPVSAWQRLYAAAHRLRVRRWSRQAVRLAVPVWSVGNLHWGGSGKTPVVMAIAAWLNERGMAVAVLSRGYGRRGGATRIVSRGDGPLLAPRDAGDEPWLLAEQLPGVAVAVARRRADAARLLLAALARRPDLFLLDDGFSHLALARDLDLLVLPADDPFGGGLLPPGGRLREPLAAAARASALLLSGPEVDAAQARAVAAALRPHGFTGDAFASLTMVGPPRRPGHESDAAPGPLLLVTGVARPERVGEAAARLGLPVVAHAAFADHHPYPRASIARILAAARAAGAVAVLTTAKDRVKLAGRLPLPLLELPLQAAPEPRFWEWLAARLPRTGTV